MSPVKVTFAVIGAMVGLVAVIILVGVFSLGWGATIERKQLDIDAENRRHGYEQQTSTRQTINHKITEWSDLDPDSPHAIAIRTEICDLAATLDGTVPTNITDFTEVNCA